jgi:hypothetical protein
MEKVREYEGQARRCEELALQAPTDAVREELLEIAALWRRTARARRIALLAEAQAKGSA